MTTLTLTEIAKTIADIDFAMLSTRAANGFLAARPMSNNGDVEYDGDSYFFAFEKSHTVEDIKRDPKIGLSFVGSKGLLGGAQTFIAIEAHAELIRDKTQFESHWNKDIEVWANQGMETPGLVLIKAHAVRIHVWHGNEERELVP
jgi:general stress protein 26